MRWWQGLSLVLATWLVLDAAYGFGEMDGFKNGQYHGRALGWEEGATATACAIVAGGDQGDAILEFARQRRLERACRGEPRHAEDHRRGRETVLWRPQ